MARQVATASDEPKIHVAGLRKLYDIVEAIAGIDLDVKQAEVVCVVGPSGCGKTTLLNLIAGFEKPTDGVLEVGGRPVSGPGPDRSVVFQQPALFPWLSVIDNVLFGFSGSRRKATQARADELLVKVGLAGFERRHPWQLSGGMMQRVAIARALVRDPEVLLMDEPFGALDAQTRLQMQEHLQTIWTAYHPTILFITHDVEEAIFLADRVVVMSRRPGRVEAVFEVRFARPRSYELLTEPTFGKIKRELLAILHGLVEDRAALAATGSGGAA